MIVGIWLCYLFIGISITSFILVFYIIVDIENDTKSLIFPCYTFCFYFIGLIIFSIFGFQKIVAYIIEFHYGNSHQYIRENRNVLNDINVVENNERPLQENLPTEQVYRFFSKIFVCICLFRCVLLILSLR